MENDNSDKPADKPVKRANWTPEEARIYGRKGGSRSSSKKKFAASLRNIRKCSDKCPMYPCWAFPLTMEGAKFEGKCALKEFSPQFQNTTVDLYLKGERGFNRQMVEILCRTGVKVTTTEEDYKHLDYLISVKKSIFGDKNKVEADIRQEQKLSTKEMMKIIKRAIDENGSENKA